MRALIVGGGAWGLPAAAELATRGHEAVLLDRHGLANPYQSSSGPTRLWRLAHPDALRVRLAVRGVAAMERLARRSGTEVCLRRGMLWRDDVSAPAVDDALAAEGIPHTAVDAADVGRFFPGLRPDGRPAVWHADAGPVLAAAALRAQAQLLERAGGTVVAGPVVREVETSDHGVVLRCADGQTFRGDVVVLAPGPGAGPLLANLGIELPLHPHLEQVVHVGDPAQPSATDEMPCLYDGPHDEPGADRQPGMYAMPTPGTGYKIGLDLPLRDLTEDDLDRTPSEAVTAQILERLDRQHTRLPTRALDAQVCSWTTSPDGRFVIDTLPGGVVVACGDSGEGFKFSALMGEVLADLAEGRAPDSDIDSFSLARFSGDVVAHDHVLGR